MKIYMFQKERVEQNRLISRTVLFGFIFFVLFVGLEYGFENLDFIVVMTVFLGFLCALLWRKLEPVTDDDLDDTYREPYRRDDTLM